MSLISNSDLERQLIADGFAPVTRGYNTAVSDLQITNMRTEINEYCRDALRVTIEAILPYGVDPRDFCQYLQSYDKNASVVRNREQDSSLANTLKKLSDTIDRKSVCKNTWANVDKFELEF